MIKVYVDGSARPNPGKGGIGVVIRGDGWDYTISKSCGKNKVTSNQAEYRALGHALALLAVYKGNTKEIAIYSDSEMLVQQLKGEKQVDRGKYVDDYLLVKRWLKIFPNITFTWIPREENAEANLLASKAIKGGM